MNYIGIGLGVLGAICMAICFYTDLIKNNDTARGVYDMSIFCVALTGVILGILNVREARANKARRAQVIDLLDRAWGDSENRRSE
jgi:hypothetical protein